MSVNRSYTVSECPEENQSSSTTNKERIYTYDEAMDLAGTGAYSLGLLVALSLTVLGVGMDIFGFSVVVTGSTCDLQLSLEQSSILLSTTFTGSIVMSYPWGYIADTRGRKTSLLISLWISFFFSTVSAFSPDWITLAVFKFLSTSFASCALSATFTLVGESCPRRVRDAYMMIMTSILSFCLAAYIGVAFFILNLNFSYDLGFITFIPWRLLALVLAMPLGLAAISILFFYESPMYLLNAGEDDEALDILAKIWTRNGGKKEYPVKKVILNEEGNDIPKGISFWRSLWEQIVPLFKPPLLWRSMQLYFLAIVVHGTNNGYFAWFPFMADKFLSGLNSENTDGGSGLCELIMSSYKNSTESVECKSGMDINLFWSSLAQGVSFFIVLFCIAGFAHRKRMLVIVILLSSGVFGLGTILIKNNIASFIMFFGLLLTELVIGLIYSYYVDLYPTSYRGMAACIGTMMARGGALGGVNLLGAYITTHCTETLYVASACLIVGGLVGFLLPPDKEFKKFSG